MIMSLIEEIDLYSLTSSAKQLICQHVKYDNMSLKNNKKAKAQSKIPDARLIEDKRVWSGNLNTAPSVKDLRSTNKIKRS